jgi:division/cell wall cluster transcriptional repressor MraZ
MSDFLGTYLIKLEEKTGRIRLPLEFVKPAGNSVAVVYGQSNCVEIYPAKAWEKLLDDFQSRPKPWTDEYEGQLRRRTRSYKKAEVKANGRVAIPSEHREHADLKHYEDVMVIGMVDHIEVWSQAQFKIAEEKYRAQQWFRR